MNPYYYVQNCMRKYFHYEKLICSYKNDAVTVLVVMTISLQGIANKVSILM